MKITIKKIQYIFKVLKCVFYMTIYNLQHSVKLPPKIQQMAFQRLLNSKCPGGPCPGPA